MYSCTCPWHCRTVSHLRWSWSRRRKNCGRRRKASRARHTASKKVHFCLRVWHLIIMRTSCHAFNSQVFRSVFSRNRCAVWPAAPPDEWLQRTGKGVPGQRPGSQEAATGREAQEGQREAGPGAESSASAVSWQIRILSAEFCFLESCHASMLSKDCSHTDVCPLFCFKQTRT